MKNILFVGYGALARGFMHCLPSIMDNFVKSIHRIIIIEPRKLKEIEDVPEWAVDKYIHLQQKILKNNLNSLLDIIKKEYNPWILLNLSTGVSSNALIDYCVNNKMHYIDTALEDWEDESFWSGTNKDIIKHSLQEHEIKALDHPKNVKTCICNIGENPGMVSLYVKLALDKVCDDYNIQGDSYAEKAMKCGLETIHISEFDTQKANIKLKNDVTYNDWSSIGLIEEGSDSVQLGWGSHEGKNKPFKGVLYNHQLLIPKRGVLLCANSYLPIIGNYRGYLIPHAEASSLTKYLEYGNYRPSAYYVYRPSDFAIKSVDNLIKNNFKHSGKYNVLTSDEIKNGIDIVGVTLYFKKLPTFCMHSILGNDFAKKYFPYTNATIIQVQCGLIAGIDYILNNPNNGVIEAEEMDAYKGFELVKPLQGQIFFDYVDYKPKTNKFVDFVYSNNNLGA